MLFLYIEGLENWDIDLHRDKIYGTTAHRSGIIRDGYPYLNYQISDIIHFELQFPGRDVQTRTDFNRPNH